MVLKELMELVELPQASERLDEYLVDEVLHRYVKLDERADVFIDDGYDEAIVRVTLRP